MAPLTGDQIAVLNIILQVGSALSIAGCIFIIGTFCFCDAFHRPINRLVFYASFGNLMASVGFMMAGSYLDQPLSAGCQTQAFLLGVFVSADAYWTLAMAVNVYLTFYFRFDAHRLRRNEILYLVLCYGVPFMPAFICLFVRGSAGQHVYGAAGMWCWFSPRWEVLRIATFYGPVWASILVTLGIYLRSGTTIYRKHRQLRKFQGSTTGGGTASATGGGGGNTVPNTKTTEVVVTSEVVTKSETLEMQAFGGQATAHASSVTPSYGKGEVASQTQTPCSQAGIHSTSVTVGAATRSSPRRAHQEINNAAWQYTKCALLFFAVILVTWLPSSANRVYTQIHHTDSSVTLQYLSAIVLPLQGFWNAVIYAVTSWTACKQLIDRGRDAVLGKVTGTRGGSSSTGSQQQAGGPGKHSWSCREEPRSSRRWSGRMGTVRNASREEDSESMTELAKTAPGSDDGRSGSLAPSRSEA
ncbi:hypothetical protein JDV02_002852 [Purpureocillium takamizusanense]|uniref:G-protein coupled receptors family 2 profile 2 domain-containing protein n=1 Tax=Purpureocillium takamizusanense TaxID=2060973 RepID=A0A9Q8Q9I1_9HYPO|nr:uncharacterized protein JDV02_002852 [Purpureocillium takamizusanense]UNI16419.1 hypothetical protein JDV02_002852 [Purpureocillium takamizusanense]